MRSSFAKMTRNHDMPMSKWFWKLNDNLIIIYYKNNIYFAPKQVPVCNKHINIYKCSWYHNGPVIGTAQHKIYVLLAPDNRAIMKSAIY